MTEERVQKGILGDRWKMAQTASKQSAEGRHNNLITMTSIAVASSVTVTGEGEAVAAVVSSWGGDVSDVVGVGRREGNTVAIAAVTVTETGTMNTMTVTVAEGDGTVGSTVTTVAVTVVEVEWGVWDVTSGVTAVVQVDGSWVLLDISA